MVKHKSTRAFTRLLQEIVNLHKSLTNQNIYWFLHSFRVGSRRQMQAGFVLPTTVLLLMIVGLVIVALMARTSNRTNQVMMERQGKVISNAATPAIDRAKAKLEYLFTQDSRLPNGVPAQKPLMDLMLHDKYNLKDKDDKPSRNETRLDLNKDGKDDNAWFYQADTDGDGVDDATIAYSIIGVIPDNQNDLSDQSVAGISSRASNLRVRNGPVSSTQSSNAACQQNQQNTLQVDKDGWFTSNNNTAVLRKNFQINAFVISTKPGNRTIATLELQQDRQLDRGNKWGAWFRNDIELNRPPVFNWNGAMHTEGSIFVGENDNFTAYLMSSRSSCASSRNASEITNAEITNDQNIVQFQGQIVNGTLGENKILDNTNRFHFIDQNNQLVTSATDARTHITKSKDSVSDTSTATPSDIALNPVTIFTQDISQANGVTANGVKNWTNVRDSDWKNKDLFSNKRIYNQREPKPYVDDTYRADNRYGPKPTYSRDSALAIPTGKKIGDPIPSTETALISPDPIGNNIENVGLDGYWERRARLEGLRVIVGQRLELGNPLAPPAASGTHQARQRRALRDNLAAVQATAIYHQANRDADGKVQDLPVACLATTVHPGTADTLKRSATFESITFKNSTNNDVTLSSDFFTGRGTNGWEYDVPTGTFPNASLEKALRNLANFAGDPDGAYPPKQEASGSTIVHPHPELTKWGDFSNLRRALNGTYTTLSTADQSYIHTAACSLGILADNIKALKDYSYVNPTNIVAHSALDGALKSVSASSPDQAISLLTNPTQARLARLIYLKEQVERDRTNNQGYSGVGYTCTRTKFNSTHLTSGLPGSGLVKLCPPGERYSALYYIFPTSDHAEARTDSYITSTSVNPTSIPDRYKAIDDTALESIRLRPRTIGTNGTWKLGRAEVTSPGADAPNDKQNALIRNVNGATTTVYRVPFKDAALFNGREMMNARVLDFDLDLLRQNTLKKDCKPSEENCDHWLPQIGIIYAFREDAVREDGIARPAGAAGSSMNAGTLQDPPITSPNGITIKPVDYLPDPDRRPYGFRFRNGADLTRKTSSDLNFKLDHPKNSRGMSFISDNPVYIQGHFNLHSTNGTTSNLLEEFTETLNTTTYENFYTRSSQETRFAQPGTDTWRPTEIIADAVTILSNAFCDGSIEDSFTTAQKGSSDTVALAQYGCASGNGQTSYLNQNRPGPDAITDWRRENPFDKNPSNNRDLSPIVINENGSPVRTSGPYSGSGLYYAFSANKPLITPTETRVNAIIVSGLVPSRANQFNGGLHNFPRFLERWQQSTTQTTTLFLSGALIQLNFSTYGTAPWDQDAWEPGGTTDPDNEFYRYYTPPRRLWGYDVALQKAAAGAVARRFVSANNTRSEFYRELPVDDPYILNLRCAKPGASTTPIDTSATCP